MFPTTGVVAGGAAVFLCPNAKKEPRLAPTNRRHKMTSKARCERLMSGPRGRFRETDPGEDAGARDLGVAVGDAVLPGERPWSACAMETSSGCLWIGRARESG